MREATVIPPGGGEVIGDSPERRVEILCDDEALSATCARFAAGRAGADLHVHRHHNDIFYVLEGELTVMLGLDGEHVAVPAGTVALVPPLVVHGFRNASDADARYLNFHAPGRRFADYLRALRDGRTFTYDQEPPPADGGRPTGLAVVGGPAVDVEEIVVREVSVAAGAGTAAAQRSASSCSASTSWTASSSSPPATASCARRRARGRRCPPAPRTSSRSRRQCASSSCAHPGRRLRFVIRAKRGARR